MGNIRCARCGAMEDEASASFGEEGLVCASCHQGNVNKDASQMRDQMVNAALPLGGALDKLTTFGTSTHESRRTGGAAPVLTGVAADLAARGARVERSSLARHVSLGPINAQSEGYKEVWTLPAAPAVQAQFTHEGLDSKLIKLFRKELQTGDAEFDKAVYIRTDTPEATTAFLARPEIRGIIGPVISRGGRFVVAGNVLEGEALWADNEPGPRPADLIARVALALLE